jgi:hypothetical protein
VRISDALIPSLDLVQRTLAVDISYTISRMQVLERIPGNPIGIAYRWIDEAAVALMSCLPAFSRVVGLRAGHGRHIEPLVQWYREHGIKPTFEMVPGMHEASLGRELARLGFYQSGFHASLIGEPVPAALDDSEGNIEPVITAEGMEDYLDAYVAGWGIAESDHAQFKANVRPWLEQGGWSLYVARVTGALRQPPPSIFMIALATLQTRQPIQHSVAAASRLPSSGGAWATPALQVPTSSSAAPSRSRPATAIWSAPACDSNLFDQSGRQRSWWQEHVTTAR